MDNFNKTPTLLNKIFDEIAVRLEAEDHKRQDTGNGSYVPLINSPSPHHKQPMEASKTYKSALEAKFVGQSVEDWKVSPGESDDKEPFKIEKHKQFPIRCETESREEKTNVKKKKNKKGDRDRQSPQEGQGGKSISQTVTPVVDRSSPSEGIYSVIKSRSTETLI